MAERRYFMSREFVAVSAILMAVARSISKSQKNQENGGRALVHQPTTLQDFQDMAPEEYAKEAYQKYIRGVNELHGKCFELAKADKGTAINKAVAEYMNSVLGGIGHITPGSFSVTRVSAATVKSICTTFDKAGVNQFRRAIEVAIFNTAVEYQYSDKPSLEYFKKRMDMEKNANTLKTMPSRIDMLKAILGKLEKDTPEYKDIENQLKGAQTSLVNAEKNKLKVATAYNEAANTLNKSIEAGTGTMLAEILADCEKKVEPKETVTRIMDRLGKKAMAEKAKKQGEKAV